VRIQNKVAIITGATSGIGRASAILFAREGAKIVAVGRRVSEGKKTVDTIHKLGGEAVFIKTDVCRATDVQEMVEKTIHTYHKIDILFNNAGILPEETKTPITNLSEEMWERVGDCFQTRSIRLFSIERRCGSAYQGDGHGLRLL
jgi:NAD(P)-dependent dehydrogenase (short-subunit alcohol dehydrogenase family)